MGSIPTTSTAACVSPDAERILGSRVRAPRRLFAAPGNDRGHPGRLRYVGSRRRYRDGRRDKFGFSWQIVPNAIPRLMGQQDPAKAKRVWEKLMTMRKIDIAALEAAAR